MSSDLNLHDHSLVIDKGGIKIALEPIARDFGVDLEELEETIWHKHEVIGAVERCAREAAEAKLFEELETIFG